MEVTEVQKITQNVIAEASKVVIAGEAVVEKLLVALLAGGHVLLEDRPGSGKTTLAKTFARLLDVEQKRVQFTPERYHGIECVQSEGWGVSSGKGTGIYKCSACR